MWLLKANRELASSEGVCLLLLTLFDPREECTPIQVLATRVFVRLVHVLHASVGEVRGLIKDQGTCESVGHGGGGGREEMGQGV